jgi:hypothetical protein
MSYFFYIITLANIIVYNYKIIIRLINKYNLSNKSFINITFTFIKLFFNSFILIAFYNNILLMFTLFIKLYYLINSSYTNKIFI